MARMTKGVPVVSAENTEALLEATRDMYQWFKGQPKAGMFLPG